MARLQACSTVAVAALVVLGWCRGSTASAADDLTTLPTGTRVRVESPRYSPSSWRPIDGAIEGVRADTLEVRGKLADEGQPRLIAIPIPSIDEIYRWKGRRGNGRVGMAVGLAIGVAVGFLVARDKPGPDRGYEIAAAGMGGILWGGIIDSQIRADRWEKVPLNEPGRSSGAPNE